MLVQAEHSAAARRSRGRPRRGGGAVIDGELLGAALHEFREHGYGGTSLSRIVRAAGISKTTLYARYPSKEVLFRAIMRQQTERLDAATAFHARGTPTNLRRGLTAYADRTLAISLEGDLLDVNRLIHSESTRFPELGAAAAERTQIGIAQVEGFIRERAAAGERCGGDPRAFAEAFIFMLRGWYVDVMLTGRAVPTRERERWVEGAVSVLLAPRQGGA